MFFTVDRFEGSLAVIFLDDGRSFNIPAALLPGNPSEGDVFKIISCPHETSVRREEVSRLIDKVFE